MLEIMAGIRPTQIIPPASFTKAYRLTTKNIAKTLSFDRQYANFYIIDNLGNRQDSVTDFSPSQRVAMTIATAATWVDVYAQPAVIGVPPGSFTTVKVGLDPANSITQVSEWENCTLQSIGFRGNSIIAVPTTLPASLKSLSNMMYSSGFNQNVNSWDTSNIENFSNVFAGCSKFNQPVNNWNTSKATVMVATFQVCMAFNQSLSNWDTSNVTNMSYMFNYASVFNQDLKMWNVSKVTNYLEFSTNSGLAAGNRPLFI